MGSIDLRFYLSLLLRRLPLLAFVVAVPTICALAFALLSPPVYRATAFVMVVSPRIPEEMARSTVSDSAVGRFHIIERQMMTPPALLALADRFSVYGEQARMTVIETADDMRSRIEIEQFWLDPDTPAAPAFAISFEAGTAELASTVANDLATGILNEDKRRRIEATSETMSFFRLNVDRLSADLASVEKRILEFRTQHLDALPDSLDFRRNQQSGQQERLLLLEREEAVLRSRRFNLSVVSQSTGRIPGAAVQTPEGQVLADLHAALVTQQALYTDDSPSIQVLKARIARLRSTTAPTEQAETTSGERPPTSELDLQLAEIDDQLKSIAAEKDRIAQASSALTASIAVTPENESVLNVLERERENIQTQYNAAIARLAQASTGEQVENDLKGERLTMLEEAPVPQSPARPKRLMIVLGGLALGLGLSAALLVALELLNHSIRRPVDLRRSLNMEPLATIPYITTGREVAARRTMILVAGLLAFAIPAAVVISVHYGLPVDTILRGSFVQVENSTQ